MLTCIFSLEILLLVESTYLIFMSWCYNNYNLCYMLRIRYSIFGTGFVSSFNMIGQVIFKLELKIISGNVGLTTTLNANNQNMTLGFVGWMKTCDDKPPFFA